MRKKISPRDCDVRLVTYGSVKDKTILDAHITVLDQGTQGGSGWNPGKRMGAIQRGEDPLLRRKKLQGAKQIGSRP